MKRLKATRTRRLLWSTGMTSVLLVLLLALLNLSSPVSRGAVGPVGVAGPVDPVGPRDEDDGPSGQVRINSEWPLEIGVEYVADYPGTTHDLPCAATNAYGVYNTLRAGGWCNFAGDDCFIWGNANAWEEDFKRHDLGGNNNNRVDDVDLVFYEGHGNSSLFTFKTPTGGGTHDDSYLTYRDARLAWGDRDLEWMALLSCSVLADSHELDWVWTMNYLHLLMGFETTAYDVCGFGTKFAQYVAADYRMPVAWFKACDQSQPAGVRAKVLAEEYQHFYDRQSYQYPDTWDNDYYRWEHACGSEPARYVDPQQVGGTMPVFQTPALSLAQRDSVWNNLTTAFEVPTQTIPALQGEGYWVSERDRRELEMDIENGLFYYVDHNNLFTVSTFSRVHIMSPQDAQAIAEQFLVNTGLMPGDAQFYEVVSETVEGVVVPGRAMGIQTGPAAVVTQTLADYQVIYSRILTYTVMAQQEPLEFSVVGPGAKIKVYVQADDPGYVVGTMGGWRRITSTGLVVQQTVPILDLPQIMQLFQQLEDEVAFEHVPFEDPTSKEILAYTLGYWEEASGRGQDQLYPVYVLQARYEGTVGGTEEPLVVTDYTYIPANETYMRPLANIESHSDLSDNIMPGEVISFTAADALKPLNELGYHESLTFTLGSGIEYSYQWYLGSVAAENQIGSGRELEYTVGTVGEPWRDVLAPQTVILVVTDLYSAHTSQSSSVDSAVFNVALPVALSVTKQATPDPVQSGAQLTYTLRVTNTGDVDLNATITDVLPSHVTPSGVLTWTPTISAPDGVWTQHVVVTVEMGYAGPLSNVVRVTTEEGAVGVYTGTSQAQVTPMLEVSKQANPDPVQAGEQLTYTLCVTNTGNVDLSATITDVLPSQVTPTGVLTWTPTITAPDGVWTQHVVVTVEMGYAGPLSNVVRVTTEEGAVGVYTETSQAQVTPMLEVSKQASPDAVQAGEQLTYTLCVTNTGNVDLSATITDVLPSQVTPTGVLTWTPTITAPGGVRTQTVVVTVELGYAGPLTNVVQVTTEEGATGVYTETTLSLAPHLEVSKQGNPDPVQAGAQLTYTLRVTNADNVDLNATITDILPSHVTPSGVLTWTPTISAPDGVWTQHVVVTVEMGYAGPLTNVVQVTTDEGAMGTATSIVIAVEELVAVEPSQGGTIIATSDDGMTTTIEIPLGAVTESTQLAYTSLPTVTDSLPGFAFAGRAFALEAYRNGELLPGLAFEEPVTVTIHYTDTDVAGLNEDTLELRYWNGSEWSTDGITVVERDTTNNRLVVTVTHLSEFATFAEGQRKVYLPAVLKNH